MPPVVGATYVAREDRDGIKTPVVVRDANDRFVTFRQWFADDPEWNGPVDFMRVEEFERTYRRQE